MVTVGQRHRREMPLRADHVLEVPAPRCPNELGAPGSPEPLSESTLTDMTTHVTMSA
jgi:hypothetical protein